MVEGGKQTVAVVEGGRWLLWWKEGDGCCGRRRETVAVVEGG